MFFRKVIHSKAIRPQGILLAFMIDMVGFPLSAAGAFVLLVVMHRFWQKYLPNSACSYMMGSEKRSGGKFACKIRTIRRSANGRYVSASGPLGSTSCSAISPSRRK